MKKVKIHRAEKRALIEKFYEDKPYDPDELAKEGLTHPANLPSRFFAFMKAWANRPQE